jgi:hypothetical protein
MPSAIQGYPLTSPSSLPSACHFVLLVNPSHQCFKLGDRQTSNISTKPEKILGKIIGTSPTQIKTASFKRLKNDTINKMQTINTSTIHGEFKVDLSEVLQPIHTSLFCGEQPVKQPTVFHAANYHKTPQILA